MILYFTIICLLKLCIFIYNNMCMFMLNYIKNLYMYIYICTSYTVYFKKTDFILLMSRICSVNKHLPCQTPKLQDLLLPGRWESQSHEGYHPFFR